MGDIMWDYMNVGMNTDKMGCVGIHVICEIYFQQKFMKYSGPDSIFSVNLF